MVLQWDASENNEEAKLEKMNSIYQKNNFWAIPVTVFHFLYQKKYPYK